MARAPVDPSASLIGDLKALARSQRSKVVVLVLAAVGALGLATVRAVDPGPAGEPEHPGRALLLLDHPDSVAAEFVRAAGFEIERSSLADASARARGELELQGGSDIDAIRAWADVEGIGYLLLRHRGPKGVVISEDARLQVALEALAHVEEEGDAARYLAIPVGDLREFGEPTVAPRRRVWLHNEGVEALEALLEQPLVHGALELHPMHKYAVQFEGRFDSGFATIRKLAETEATRTRVDAELRASWAQSHLLRAPYHAGTYRAVLEGAVDTSAEHEYIALEVDKLQLRARGEPLVQLRGSLLSCASAISSRSSFVSADPIIASADLGALVLADSEGRPELWRFRRSEQMKGVCAWEKMALAPEETGFGGRRGALHASGLYVSLATDPDEDVRPTVIDLSGERQLGAIVWPADLDYGTPVWVDWPEGPLLALPARARGAQRNSFVLLWHPRLGGHSYQAGLSTLGLTQAFEALHTRPGHEGELLVSSGAEGGALYRLKLPFEAVEARLEYAQVLGALAEGSAPDEPDVSDPDAPWKVATLLREEPLDEVVVDAQGLRVATLANLPGTQSLRVISIEEGRSVVLTSVAGEQSRLVFDAGGQALVSHLLVEADEGEVSLIAPRRHALPQSLHAATILRREAMLKVLVDESRPSINDVGSGDRGEVSVADPDAAREVPTP